MSQQIIRIGDLLVETVHPGDLIKSDLINAIIENLDTLNQSGTGTTGLVSVPNLVGRTLSDARSILAQATTHLSLGAVFDASGVGFSGAATTVQTRLIINQVPSSGSRVASGTAVDLVLAVPPSTGGGTTPTSTRPTITTIVGPRVGEARIGDPVTINGSNFDLTLANNEVMFGTSRAPTPTSSNGNALVVVVPDVTIPAGGQVAVTVRVPGRTPNDTSLPVNVTVLPRAAQPSPVITGATVPPGNNANSFTEGDLITIRGTGFATALPRNRIFFATVEVGPETAGSSPGVLSVRVPTTLSEAIGMTGSGRRPVAVRVRNLDIEDASRNTSADFMMTLEM